ncbi:L-amino acid N-acyltransferase YncA [Tistlia consotensis]|uniref:L-amino acid N-acyltransferase YncA n=1 Tax=Tistlia consotensis USBA 355 TaxID=560819 RepID=A0A1Y6BCI6_9PROT|nr:GNAT family N-acetyltransferase [Tistlia consotensis]SME97694.1 L-amino acid N-acyltransferase YncA [Tistlia consotensis USBA 355]SNR57062.1 L-amino acid N-acyltransferase YncA [Tistlia consotensis]
MPGVTIRPAVEADCATLLSLIRELAVFEGLLDHLVVDEARLRRDGFGPTPRFSCLLAEADGEALGLALYFPTYSTFAGEGALYVEDLIVREAARGRGVGRALLAACAAEAERQGCARVMLAVLDWNRPARQLYESLGFRELSAWRPYGLAGEAFRALAREGRGD